MSDAAKPEGIAIQAAGLPVAVLCLAYGAGALFLGVVLDSGLVAAIGLALPLIWLSIIDLQRREIPDTASALVALTGGVLWWSEPTTLLFTTLIATTAALLLAGIGEWAWRRWGRDVFGLGDVKLIGAGILVVGAEAMWLMLFLASVGGIVAAVLGRRSASAGVPFGPFLAYAIFVTHLIAGPMP